MPDQTEIQSERERLYESEVLREDINDDEATVLLEWGEKHIVRLAGEADDSKSLEQQARFLRQLIKNINRFVGQRQYNNHEEQLGYMAKVVQWLPNLGFKTFTAEELLDKMPPDAKDMGATLRALLDAIDPGNASPTETPGGAPSQDLLNTLKDAASAQSTKADHPSPHSRGAQDVSQTIHQEAAHAAEDKQQKSVKDQLEQLPPTPKENDVLNTLWQSVKDHMQNPSHSADLNSQEDPKKLE